MFVSTTRLQLESKDFFLYSISENLLSVYYACILEKEYTEMSKTMSLFPRNLQFMGGTGQLQDRITEMHRRREEGYKTQTGRSGKLPGDYNIQAVFGGRENIAFILFDDHKKNFRPKVL